MPLPSVQMHSRRLSSSPNTPASADRHRTLLLAVTISASSLIILALLLLFFYLYLSLRRTRTLPCASPSSPYTAVAVACPLHVRRFSHRAIRSATAAFDPSRTIGRGASAVVFRGILPDGKSVAVKRLISSPSSPTRAAASDREFQNELQVLAALQPSPFVVALLGYCLEGRLLVYEYMSNGSLQEALFASNSPLSWDSRFSIIVDVAQALAFLHLECDPPVVHGDIKPSNVLLGFDFRAKLCDFGLSRIKAEIDLSPEFFSHDFKSRYLVPESPQIDLSLDLRPSPSNNYESWSNLDCSPRGREAAAVASPVQDESFSFEGRKELGATSPVDDGTSESNGQCGKEWWWRQEESGQVNSKDYVSEWIGSQICSPGNRVWNYGKEISSENSVGDETHSGNVRSMIADKKQERRKGGRKMREWWKEEYFAELSKKGEADKERKWFPTSCSRVEKGSTSNYDDARRGRELIVDISFRRDCKKKRSRSVGSDMLSGDILSRELSSTTSMRGTLCYVAPECHGFEQQLEKADIYSFGVLILVTVSGRRPLQVLSSPVKMEKANLVSWCRLLAQTGNLLDLVDERLKGSYNEEQASLCISLALLCLQRIPELRPDSGEIVKILKGEMELPVVPYDFSPSPPAAHFSRSRRKASVHAESSR